MTFYGFGVARYRREHDTPGRRPEALECVADWRKLSYCCDRLPLCGRLVRAHVQAECRGNHQRLLLRDNGAAKICGCRVEGAQVTAAQVALGELGVVQGRAGQVDIAE